MDLSEINKDTQLDPMIPTPWFSTSELLEYLCISEEELFNQKKLFVENIHYMHESPNDPSSRLLWRIDLIGELLCVEVPLLEKEAMNNAINNRITCQN